MRRYINNGLGGGRAPKATHAGAAEAKNRSRAVYSPPWKPESEASAVLQCYFDIIFFEYAAKDGNGIRQRAVAGTLHRQSSTTGNPDASGPTN